MRTSWPRSQKGIRSPSDRARSIESLVGVGPEVVAQRLEPGEPVLIRQGDAPAHLRDVFRRVIIVAIDECCELPETPLASAALEDFLAEHHAESSWPLENDPNSRSLPSTKLKSSARLGWPFCMITAPEEATILGTRTKVPDPARRSTS